jgi:hypothetical protein
MTEPEVILQVHNFLKKDKLWGLKVNSLYTDAHHTLLGYNQLKPFQRITLDLGDFKVFPDIVGKLSDGETIFAVEAKGSSDIIKGLAQAEIYQNGFHCSFLAASADSIGSGIERIVRNKNLGLFSVNDSVKVVNLPEPIMPWKAIFKLVAKQIDSSEQITGKYAFIYNMPTHYLVWTILLKPFKSYRKSDFPSSFGRYPMPKNWVGALRGAAKLGLVIENGNEIKLSPIGETIHSIVNQDLDEWTNIHNIISKRGSDQTLNSVVPVVAATLRLLLLNDPIISLIHKVLYQEIKRECSFLELAKVSFEIDFELSLIFFFNPECIDEIMSGRGVIKWEKLEGRHFRSTTFYQYKSIMIHSGLLKKTKLGGASSKFYVY